MVSNMDNLKANEKSDRLYKLFIINYFYYFLFESNFKLENA